MALTAFEKKEMTSDNPMISPTRFTVKCAMQQAKFLDCVMAQVLQADGWCQAMMM